MIKNFWASQDMQFIAEKFLRRALLKDQMKEFENMQQKQSLGLNLKKTELGSKEKLGAI